MRGGSLRDRQLGLRERQAVEVRVRQPDLRTAVRLSPAWCARRHACRVGWVTVRLRSAGPFEVRLTSSVEGVHDRFHPALRLDAGSLTSGGGRRDEFVDPRTVGRPWRSAPDRARLLLPEQQPLAGALRQALSATDLSRASHEPELRSWQRPGRQLPERCGVRPNPAANESSATSPPGTSRTRFDLWQRSARRSTATARSIPASAASSSMR